VRVLYVAGKYRDPRGVYFIWKNIETARDVAVHLWQMGAAVICPHANTSFFDGSCPDERWLGGDLELLARCDGVVMLPGWEQSAGAVGEWQAAQNHGLQVFYWKDGESIHRLQEWLAE